ncbi:lef-4 [Sucra jujuba nucleopolyhedrovirus]|uniref:Lef-4 n=1 Tax=Sucra jujuba nucleopolyhedrovirus TaxID=1563660 RepID=A0A097P914_9ABAC|nr:lef-4 [Sucra jujuba nucleopolyhedrovirus]AIU41313.1 lef-4 [Sucra jujuba nucleopolyhedrovirus]
MSTFIEKELSYSINFSQDLLYIILSSYISKKYTLTEEYTDFVDENDIRTRLVENSFESTMKTPQSLQKTVYVNEDSLVPMVNRVCIEQGMCCEQLSSNLKRISTCQVFIDPSYPQIEIKFEKVYFEKNLSDTFDSLMANKQVALLNLLQNKHEKITHNSHLGSDEIYVYLRLEYEYDDEEPDRRIVRRMCEIITDIDAIALPQNISPMLPYTMLQNNIIYRKFEGEMAITNFTNDSINIHKWAIKLDGIRGRGLFVRNFMIIFMDDMRMFSSEFPCLFSVNNVVAFQCELIDNNQLYITDLLHVFKYTYNNRTQYECSLNHYNIEPLDAIETLNRLSARYNHKNLCISAVDTHNMELLHEDEKQSSPPTMLTVKFQKFFDPPLVFNGYSTVPTDGYVLLNENMQYVKCKAFPTYELEYNNVENVFYSLDGPLLDYKIDCNNIVLKHKKIYEVKLIHNEKILHVIKCRNDRLVPQTL